MLLVVPFPLDVASNSFLPFPLLIYVYLASLTASIFFPPLWCFRQALQLPFAFLPLCDASIRRRSFQLPSCLNIFLVCRLHLLCSSQPFSRLSYTFLVITCFYFLFFFSLRSSRNRKENQQYRPNKPERSYRHRKQVKPTDK